MVASTMVAPRGKMRRRELAQGEERSNKIRLELARWKDKKKKKKELGKMKLKLKQT